MPPQVATHLPADPELRLLCECFRLLATVHLVVLLISTSSDAVEVREHRVANEAEGTEHPQNAGREPPSSGASSEAEH